MLFHCMKKTQNITFTGNKTKALDVLFNDTAIAQALYRMNVFVVDHDPHGQRLSNSMMPDKDVMEQLHYDPSKWLDYVHEDDRERVRLIWETVIVGKKDIFEAEYRFLVNGEYRWIANKGTMVYRSEDGQPELYIAADRDITEERRLRQLLEEERERLAQLVIRDDFLNIPNRRYLETKQSQFFANDGHTPVAVLVLDIDNFKQLNTHLTHQGGDLVLERVVKTLQTCLSRSDILARYGGDEFVVILPNTAFEDAQYTAQRLLDAVSQISIPEMNNALLSISVGLAYCTPTPAEPFWQYFEEADKLLLQAKARGKAQVHSKNLP